MIKLIGTRIYQIANKNTREKEIAVEYLKKYIEIA